jgi:hypothetical protein
MGGVWRPPDPTRFFSPFGKGGQGGWEDRLRAGSRNSSSFRPWVLEARHSPVPAQTKGLTCVTRPGIGGESFPCPGRDCSELSLTHGSTLLRRHDQIPAG